jgi:hypothetical protein
VAIVYSVTAINARLAGVVTAIDSGGGNGLLRLYAGGLIVSSIPLAIPSGTVAGGVLTFTTPVFDPLSAGVGFVTAADIANSAGVLMISGLTVGLPLSGANVIVSNGFNTLNIGAGQVVTLVSGQIVGS